MVGYEQYGNWGSIDMKKFLSVFLCVLMCVSFSPMTLAANSRNTRDISLETTLASQLKELGLFQGVGKNADETANFDLNREPNRVEALTMLVRALGKEAEAAAYPKTHPFSDVPAWADGYVSYAYDKGLTKGVSKTLFGAKKAVSAEMYLTFILRALGYSDDGDRKDFTCDTPWALASWCRILPLQVDRTHFLRADVVDVTCAALYASIKGMQTTLHERLVTEGVFTKEQFKTAFPEYPFTNYRLINEQITAAVAERAKLGLLDENIYAAECHYISEMTEDAGVITMSVLVCYGEYQLSKDNKIKNDNSTVASWRIQLDAKTLQLQSCHTAGEYRAKGLTLKDCFSDKTLADLTALRFPMRDVCQMEVQTKLDSGLIRYKEPTYEETLAKVTASLTEVTKTLEADSCTALLGKSKGKEYYELYLIFKPGSVVGEGKKMMIKSSLAGDLRLSEDGLTLYYSYLYKDRIIYQYSPPAESIPKDGTCIYTIDLNTQNTRITLRDMDNKTNISTRLYPPNI